jgi:hypothetical protein
MCSCPSTRGYGAISTAWLRANGGALWRPTNKISHVELKHKIVSLAAAQEGTRSNAQPISVLGVLCGSVTPKFKTL